MGAVEAVEPGSAPVASPIALVPRVALISFPVSVLVTTRDSVVPPGRQMKLADAIPHATVVTIEGDHGVFVESPKLFAQKIVEACQAVKAAPPEGRRVLPWRPS